MMRSTIVTPDGVVCSKNPRETMSLEWATAARRRRAFSRSSGSPRPARIWLCRQRMAERIAPSLPPVGARSAFSQLCWAVRASGLPRAMWARTGFEGRATPFAGPACEVAAGTRSPAQRTVSAAVRRSGWGMGVRPPGADERLEFGLGARRFPKCRYVARSFGSPAGSESPVALRPVLAEGLPLSGRRASPPLSAPRRGPLIRLDARLTKQRSAHAPPGAVLAVLQDL